MSFRGTNFVPPDDASRLLGHGEKNIENVIQTLSPLLDGRAPPFEEALNWIQFDYTADRAGSYMALASTVLAHSVVLEGYQLFFLTWRHPKTSYLGVK